MMIDLSPGRGDGGKGGHLNLGGSPCKPLSVRAATFGDGVTPLIPISYNN